jgi:riboflavin synthase
VTTQIRLKYDWGRAFAQWPWVLRAGAGTFSWWDEFQGALGMFTGIITDIGKVVALEHAGDLRARIQTAYDTDGIDMGASIASDGVCLTVVALGDNWYDVDISAETLSKTNLGAWTQGKRVNLERALRVGDELGGHIVSGHVDGVAEVISVVDEGDSTRVQLRAPEALSRFIAPKGSVALNGTSLTVNEVQGDVFGINFIPHTKDMTTWGDVAVGDAVNLEIDTLARYVARLAEAG